MERIVEHGYIINTILVQPTKYGDIVGDHGVVMGYRTNCAIWETHILWIVATVSNVGYSCPTLLVITIFDSWLT